MREFSPFSVEGSVARVSGHEVEVRGLRLRLGDHLDIAGDSGRRIGEVVAVGTDGATALVLGETDGLGRGDRVTRLTSPPGAVAGRELLGRVIDAMGQPLDGHGGVTGRRVELDAPVPHALERRRIDASVATGIRLVDTSARWAAVSASGSSAGRVSASRRCWG